MNNNFAQRTNGSTPWQSSTSVNYTGPTYFNNNATQQQTQTQTTTVVSIGNHNYGVPSNMIFTSYTNKK